ncbi:platelet glycoprotein VI-like [Gracilinanus agilis]|uniref:platelet glycoprotein VI-like n=1 Tax=Gracilinanus agilis TaxID=191870 RepID=UPI001CFCB49B|nr:platelet glycoprotein VI-like [Gracilinanus agilis]
MAHPPTLPLSPGTIMTPILCALLSLDGFPRPSLRAENGSLVPEGRNVTLRCRVSWVADLYRLEKKQGSKWVTIMDVPVAENEGKFFLSSVTWSHAGTYYCRYRHVFFWSESSDALKLVVTDLYVPPFLAALPSPDVASGQDVTLQCQSELWYDWFALYKDGEEISRSKIQPHQNGSQAKFLFPAVTSIHGGTYQCYTFLSDNLYLWSSPSAPLVLSVSGEAAPAPPSPPPLPSSLRACSGPVPEDPRDPTPPAACPGVLVPQRQCYYQFPGKRFEEGRAGLKGNKEGIKYSQTPSLPNAAAQDYTVGNLVRLILAGLVLVLLGVLMIENWHSLNDHKNQSREPVSEQSGQARPQERSK